MPLPNLKNLTPKFKFNTASIAKLVKNIGEKMNPSSSINHLKEDMLSGMKKALTQETYSKAAKKVISKALTIEAKPSGLKITANHPAWKTLIEGQRKQQMTWLTKSKVPIPIVTESGKVIFRSATAKSMADGKWIHPGRPKGSFTDQARKFAYKFLSDRLGSEVAQDIARSSK